VLQFATGATGNPVNSGVLRRVELFGCTTAPNDCPRKDVVTALNRPTSFAIRPDGAIYVTNNGTSPTAGQVLRIELEPDCQWLRQLNRVRAVACER
jgi:hypothetical protein